MLSIRFNVIVVLIKVKMPIKGFYGNDNSVSNSGP